MVRYIDMVPIRTREDRMPSGRKLRCGIAAIGLALAFGTPARAADPAYPTRPIRLIVPFAAGGSSDSLGRVIAPELSRRLGQPVVVENKPGAGGNLGIDQVAKAAPDGYTIGLASPGPVVVNVTLIEGLPYDPVRDLTPIALIADLPIVLVANKALAADDIRALIAADKADPGKLFFASAGIGTTMHLSGELFNSMAGTRLEHVPYKGAGAAITDLVAGRVQLGFLDLPAAGPHVKSGALKILAVGNAKRAAALPDTPTIAEAGLAGYRTSGWFGLVAPARVPADVVARLYEETAAVLAEPGVRERMSQIGIEPTMTTPDEFGAFIKAEIPKWAEVIEVSGAKGK
jgi:tripartite-type tricarboxylate transporter receptor subunit TctC